MSLLGLCGKSGSGKDTIADLLVANHGWVKIALADKMKRICKDIFGFTDEQLWGPSSTRDVPDPRLPRPAVVTNFMADGHRTSPEPVRPGVFACVRCGSEVTVNTAVFDAWALERCGPAHLTPRHALQQLGTEFGRDCYENVWIDCTIRVAQDILTGNGGSGYPGYTPQHGPNTTSQTPTRGVVISDVRFPNEVAAIRAAGGVLWKTTYGAGLTGAAGAHASESYVDSLDVDIVIPGNLAISALPVVVKTLLDEVRVTRTRIAGSQPFMSRGPT